MGVFGKEESHESYGQMEISRVTSSQGVPLYGTSSKFKEYISLKISHSKFCRDLHRAWHFPTDTIIEINMSPAQFAEAITSLNNGSTPVTIHHTKDNWKIQDPPFVDERDLFQKEFSEDIKNIMKKAKDASDKANEILGQKTVTKTALKEVVEGLNSIKRDIESNMDFLVSSFNEYVDKAVSSAKIEVEAYIDHKIRNTGIEALKLSEGAPKAMFFGGSEAKAIEEKNENV